jgi:enoyl-CoA hydratase
LLGTKCRPGITRSPKGALMSDLSVDIVDHVATVTLDRAPVNAVTFDTYDEIVATFNALGEDKDVRVVVFTAAGDRAFMAGIDLRAIGVQDTDPPATRITDPSQVARDAMWAVRECAVPVIGAINGPALGAGLAFVACCDILVASDNATFGTTEINVGLLGASAHLSLMVGRHKAREMLFTGEPVSADELHRLCAIRAVVPRDELLQTARELAVSLAAKSPIALRLAKESMNRVEFLPLEEAYRTEQDYTARLSRFDDAKEAQQAYLEKRDPDWKWR